MQYITTMREDRVPGFQIRNDAYELREERGWVWLQKLCFTVLEWIGAHYLERVETITCGPLDSTSVRSRVGDAVFSLCDARRYDVADMVVLLGTDEYMEMIRGARPHEVFSWGISLAGVPVSIVHVPWLRGMAVVPRKFVRGTV